MNSQTIEDQELKAEIDEIMESVDQVVNRLEKCGLLKKESKNTPEPKTLSNGGLGPGKSEK